MKALGIVLLLTGTFLAGCRSSQRSGSAGPSTSETARGLLGIDIEKAAASKADEAITLAAVQWRRRVFSVTDTKKANEWLADLQPGSLDRVAGFLVVSPPSLVNPGNGFLVLYALPGGGNKLIRVGWQKMDKKGEDIVFRLIRAGMLRTLGAYNYQPGLGAMFFIHDKPLGTPVPTVSEDDLNKEFVQ